MVQVIFLKDKFKLKQLAGIVVCSLALFMQVNAQTNQSVEQIRKISHNSSTIDSIQALIPKIDQLIESGRVKEFQELATSLEEKAARIDNDSLRQKILINHSFGMGVLGNYDKSLELANNGLLLGKETIGLYLALISIKATAAGQLGQIDSALVLFNEAIQMADEHGLHLRKAALINNQAVFLSQIGKEEEALKAYQQALIVGEELQDTSLTAMALSNIGKSFLALNDVELAEKYLIRSYNLALKQGHIPNQLVPLSNLLYLFLGTKETQRADTVYANIEYLAEKINNPTRTLQIKFHFAKDLKARGKLNEAETIVLEVFTIAKEAMIKEAMAYSSSMLGELYVTKEELEKARHWNLLALKLSREIKDQNLTLSILETQRLLLEKRKEPSKAYFYLKELSVLKDSIFNANREALLAEQRALLETQQKEFEIEQLESETKIKNAKLKTQQYALITLFVVVVLIAILALSLYRFNVKKRKLNDQLQHLNDQLQHLNNQLNVQYKKFQVANQDKNILLSLLAHDLQSPISALRLLINYISRKFTDTALQPIINDIDHRLEIESSMVDQLLEWATQYNYAIEPDLRPINVYTLVAKVIEQQQRVASLKQITIHNNCVDTYSIQADPNLLVVVLRNLLANALKFSKTGTSIYVSCKREHTHIIVEIRDEGVGMSEQVQKNLFTQKKTSSKGTEEEHGTGLGLSLSKEFVEKMNGNLTFTSNKGKGTSFFIHIPSA